MTESIRCIIDQIWFPCVKCGKEITHYSMHSCFVMNPDILPTEEEWRLVCKMVKQQRELTNEEISDIRDTHLAPKYCDIYTFARAILKAASCEETKPYESNFVKNARLRDKAGEE